VKSPRLVPPFIEAMFVTTIFALGLFGILRPLYATSLKSVPNPNEGWLAVAVAAWRDGLPLYPGPEEFFVVNYPPLAFIPYRALDAVFGDVILAGRWLSWLLFLILCLAVSGAVYTAAKRFWPAFVSGILVFATFSVWYTGNLGIAEPQLLGHVLTLFALFILLRSPESWVALCLATVLMLAAGLVKPNLLGFPLGVAGWLWWTRPRDFLFWVFGCIVALGLTALALFLCFGGDFFFPNVLLGRVYSLHVLLQNMKVISSIAVPLCVCLLFLNKLRSTQSGLLICFVMLGSLIELLSTGAAFGTAYNVGYDLALSACVGTGVLLGQLEDVRLQKSRLRAIDLILFAVIVSMMVAILPKLSKRDLSLETRIYLLRRDKEIRRVVAVLSSIQGNVACVHLSYCYWAGKRSRTDLSMLPQGYFQPTRSPIMLRRQIEYRSFAAIELGSVPPRGFDLSEYRPVYSADPSVLDSIVSMPSTR